MTTLRRPSPWALLAAAILLVPFVEIVLLVRLGQAIGAGWTILILIADAILGAALVRKEGRRAWEALMGALVEGRMPGRELADAAIVLAGGTLLITPGFVTDAIGLVCVVPATRPLARTLLRRLVARRVSVLGGGFPPPGAAGPWSAQQPRGGAPSDPTVIRGDVVDE